MKKIYVVLLHIVYWLPSLITMLISLYSLWQIDRQDARVNSHLSFRYVYFLNPAYFIIGLLVFYWFYFYFFPKYLAKQKIGLFIIYGLIACAVPIFLSSVFLKPIMLKAYPSLGKYNWGLDISFYIGVVTKVVSSAIAACMFRGLLTWYQDIRYKKELENKNLQTELALLKAQINPHFLFNTLNNIDILIEKDAQTASVYLKKLSDILRFTLYESPAEFIPLKKEMEYIDRYIELQKIRTNNADFVSFDVSGNIDDIMIAPTLFIPFIENAFKHSTNKKINKAIIISINASANRITFSCSNVYDADVVNAQEKGGLGIGLIRNRLDLLYPHNYELEIVKTADRFVVNLTINLE